MKGALCLIYAFLRAVRGNWRNSVFVKCGSCPYNVKSCEGFLLAADADGRPILLHAGVIRAMSGESPDLSECSTVMSRDQFKTLYADWLQWSCESSDECELWQVSHVCKRPDNQAISCRCGMQPS